MLCVLVCILDYTNQEYRTFFEIDSSLDSSDLTCRILVEYYFSDVAVLLFQNLQQKGNKSIFHKGLLV